MQAEDELRRTDRLDVCCRVDVRDRFGVWNAVTEDVCDRGCKLVTAKLPRVGSMLEMTISSDLFPESLEVLARTVWVSSNRIGVAFLEPADDGLTPSEWIARVVEHGRIGAPGPRALGAPRVVPVVQRAGRAADLAGCERDGVVVRLPVTRR
jgi:PilZ domain-containing protein